MKQPQNQKSINLPDSPDDIVGIRIADACHMAPVETITKTFGCSRRSALYLLRNLRIPLVHLGHRVWYNLYAFDKIFYFLTRPEGPGLKAPGTRARERSTVPGAQTISDDDLDTINSPEFTLEWLTMSSFRVYGRSTTYKHAIKTAKANL